MEIRIILIPFLKVASSSLRIFLYFKICKKYLEKWISSCIFIFAVTAHHNVWIRGLDSIIFLKKKENALFCLLCKIIWNSVLKICFSFVISEWTVSIFTLNHPPERKFVVFLTYFNASTVVLIGTEKVLYFFFISNYLLKLRIVEI